MSLTDNYGPVHPSAARGFFFVAPWPIIHFEKLLVLPEHVLNDPGPRPCLVFGIIEGTGNILLFPLKLALIRWQRFSEILENNCCTIWAPDLRASKPYHPNRFMEIFSNVGDVLIHSPKDSISWFHMVVLVLIVLKVIFKLCQLAMNKM